jgi:hypothetical protein
MNPLGAAGSTSFVPVALAVVLIDGIVAGWTLVGLEVFLEGVAGAAATVSGGAGAGAVPPL